MSPLRSPPAIAASSASCSRATSSPARRSSFPGRELVYGQSITDACIGWDETRTLLAELAQAVRAGRSLSVENAAPAQPVAVAK
jgi:hypothetical protein